MKRIYSALLFSLTALLLLSALSGCSGIQTEVLTVDFYKIGKADTIFLQGNNTDGSPFYVLIDTGEEDDAPEIVEKLRASGVTSLDCLILTHFDRDHIGGLPAVLEAIPAKRILMPDYIGSGTPYEAMTALFSDGNYPVEVLTEDTMFSYGKTQISVSVPKQAEYEKKQDNNASLVISVTYGNQFLYLAGDAEQARQKELITELSAVSVSGTNLLKVPHHGVYNQGLDAFLAACKPQNAIITCSDKNPPDPETLSLLSALDSRIYLTSDGDVRAVCTENSITITQKP